MSRLLRGLSLWLNVIIGLLRGRCELGSDAGIAGGGDGVLRGNGSQWLLLHRGLLIDFELREGPGLSPEVINAFALELELRELRIT